LIKDFIIYDYETKAIRRRPVYPPEPVGLAIEFPGQMPRYHSWGHPTNNNSTWSEAHNDLRRAYESGLPLVAHYGKFEEEVSQVHMLMKPLPWHRAHDTMYLLFLQDPHAESLELKPSAERILGMKPEERDRLKEWILEHIPEAHKKPSTWGEYICMAPGDLAGRYAIGDLRREKGLFNKLHREICDRGMRPAYDRERRLMPLLLEAERTGVRADLKGMERDLPLFEAARERVATYLRKRLKQPDLNFESKRDLGEALNKAGMVTDWTWTAGGKNTPPQRSVSKKTMTIDKFRDPKFGQEYGYWVRMGTVLKMFLRSWIETASLNGGYIKPNWNQVRQQSTDGDFSGTRTGRPSCDDPNLFNVSKNFTNNKNDGYYHPAHLAALPELPLMRTYLLPDKDGLWLHRDFNQQELRMLAHFEGGPLCERYNLEPRFDIHSTMEIGIEEITTIALGRDRTKIVDFSSIYGKGATGLSVDLHIDMTMTKLILAAKAALMPGVDHPINGLAARVKARGAAGEAIRTWGGREYFAEEPGFNKKFGYVMDYLYKLLNYLVQGSSADVTKEAMIRYDEHPRREGRFLVAVYDEINVSTPSMKGLTARAVKDFVAREMAVLRECMESVEVDVPMLTDGKLGKNWGALAAYDKPEEPLALWTAWKAQRDLLTGAP